MLLFLYEDSFEGFLCAVFEAFKLKKDCLLMRENVFSGASLYETVNIPRDPQKAVRVMNGMNRLSSELAESIYLAWLSELPDIEDSILASLRLGFAKNCDPQSMLYEDCVKAVESARRKVWAEIHLYMGIIRFREAAKDIFIADIKPKYCVLPAIAEHFHERFCSMRFAIRDLNRKLAVISEPSGWYLTKFDETAAPLPESGMFERLWKEYFETIAIEQRKNPKLQRSYLPVYYRDKLDELKTDKPDHLGN